MDTIKLPLTLLFVTHLTLGKLYIFNLKHAKKKIKHAKKIHYPMGITLSWNPDRLKIWWFTFQLLTVLENAWLKQVKPEVFELEMSMYPTNSYCLFPPFGIQWFELENSLDTRLQGVCFRQYAFSEHLWNPRSIDPPILGPSPSVCIFSILIPIIPCALVFLPHGKDNLSPSLCTPQILPSFPFTLEC